MNHASEDLINEHNGILHGLNILEMMLKTDISTRDFIDLAGFFQLFADKCHHGKEEGLLFPAMEMAGIPKETGHIGQLLLEHAEGRKYLSQMNAALLDNSIKKDELCSAAGNYIDLLRRHIEKENKILFPLADRKIPEVKQQELAALFEEFEEKVMGKGTHEKLHRLLNRLEKKYLK
ncbi:MAG TPA: hemerythrin domain-containing protein [Smithellaceae bacterium]|nr:hemerythrin domain-containing protein [Smithellaceae bacterium]